MTHAKTTATRPASGKRTSSGNFDYLRGGSDGYFAQLRSPRGSKVKFN